MSVFICKTCGTSFPESERPPARCAICEDERQYVPATGQCWVRREALTAEHRNAWRRHEPDLFSLQTMPAFGINQRAFLLQTPSGNILWDCVALFDDATETLIHGLGGIQAIAISHPHYYTTMQDWAAAFDAPIFLHAADRDWVVRPDPAIRFWDAETLDFLPDVTLVRLGGHFPGGTVLHWAGALDRVGTLLVGDIVQVAPGGQRVSFMWSYPNMMPLPAAEIRRIVAGLAPWHYDRVYGAFDGQNITEDGPGILRRSAERYISLVENPAPLREP